MHDITIGRLNIRILPPAARPDVLPSPVSRLLQWLEQRRTQAEMAVLTPRLRADAGLPPRAPGPALAAFPLPPAPLWNAGLTPQPGAAARRR